MVSKALAVASDHRGIELKEEIKKILAELGYEVNDLGPSNTDSVDYPDYAGAVSEKVSSGECDRGILVCATGVGMSIAANKYPHVRCALAQDVITAEMSRRHNDANVLALGAITTPKDKVRDIVKIWLETEFEGGRHSKRVKKIEQIEDKVKSGKL